MKQEREEAERALAQQRLLYETKLQEAMDMNTSNVSSSSSSEHSEFSCWDFCGFRESSSERSEFKC